MSKQMPQKRMSKMCWKLIDYEIYEKKKEFYLYSDV